MYTTRGTVSSLLQKVGVPRFYDKSSAKGVQLLGGATSDLEQWWAIETAYGYLGATLNYGHAAGSISTLSTWGNAAIQADMETLRSNMIASGDHPTGPMHMLGISMGGLCALNFAKAKPTMVKSLCLVIPVVDVQDIYTNNRGSFASAISTAYGGAPPDAQNPADNTSSFTSFPIRIYYSTTDNICLPAITESFATATGAELVSMGAIGHLWGAPLSGVEIAGFFEENE